MCHKQHSALSLTLFPFTSSVPFSSLVDRMSPSLSLVYRPPPLPHGQGVLTLSVLLGHYAGVRGLELQKTPGRLCGSAARGTASRPEECAECPVNPSFPLPWQQAWPALLTRGPPWKMGKMGIMLSSHCPSLTFCSPAIWNQ